MYTSVLIFAGGLIMGGLTAFAVTHLWYRGRIRDKLAIEASLNEMAERMARLPLDMLGTVSGQIIEQNKQVLATERSMTASELAKFGHTVTQITAVIRELEKDRESKFGELSEALLNTNRHHKELAALTHQLHSVMYQKQARGQWGERMAEDILRIAGMQEGINYNRQHSLTSSGLRPDFSFMLPKGLSVNMDAKFPLENYSRYVNAVTDDERHKALSAFITDVRRHIKALSCKDYVSLLENTVDYVIMFIPSDLIYTVIFQEAPALLDEALKCKVVLCSPSTLYAVLAVIRQAVDNYALERSTDEILRLMELFIKEWDNYSQKIEGLGKRIDALAKEYGELANLRTQRLGKPVQAFNTLLKNRSIDDRE